MAVAHEKVANQLREYIILGKWQPGSRLPKRTEIISEISSNATVVQNAIAQLVNEGYIEVGARRSGTRVAMNPPHMTRFYLIFPHAPSEWGQFFQTLERVAQTKNNGLCNISSFCGVRRHQDIADYESLISDVKSKSVAGLIFASSAEEFIDTPLLEASGIPRVAIARGGSLPGIPKLDLNLDSFIERAVEHLVLQGRKRLAILGPREITQIFELTLSKYGLEKISYFMQYPNAIDFMGGGEIVDLMVQLPPSERPDGLILVDDNWVEGVIKSLLRNKTNVPEELSLVAISNFPHSIETELPVTRFGFDIPFILELLMKRLNEVSMGTTPPENTSISVIPEEDFVEKK